MVPRDLRRTERRPRRWHRLDGASAQPGEGLQGVEPLGSEGGPRSGHLIVLLIILGCILLLGMAAPPIRLERLLAVLGFH